MVGYEDSMMTEKQETTFVEKIRAAEKAYEEQIDDQILETIRSAYADNAVSMMQRELTYDVMTHTFTIADRTKGSWENDHTSIVVAQIPCWNFSELDDVDTAQKMDSDQKSDIIESYAREWENQYESQKTEACEKIESRVRATENSSF